MNKSTLDQEVTQLRKIPLFSSVDMPTLKLIAFASEKLTFDDGQILFRQNDAGDSAYVILGGIADIIVTKEGTDVVVAQLKDNALLGEISIFCDIPRTATVKANGPLTTLKIGKSAFLDLIHSMPGLGAKIIRELALRLAKTTADLTEAQTRGRA